MSFFICVSDREETSDENDQPRSWIHDLFALADQAGVVQDSLSLFEPVDGGAERACRGATLSDNQPTYFLVTSAVDLASCQLLLASV